MNLTEKIISSHLISGEPKAGSELCIQIDQTLTQDSTGTMTYLQLEAMNINKVKTKKSVAYIDHNTLQAGFENADDHKYIQTVAAKHGIYFSKPGNGICHQVHLERFSEPGLTLLGSDSHTPTCGAMCMLAIGAGGLSVAAAMATGRYYLTMPKVTKINLEGRLQKNVSAKDIILEVLRLLTVKGGVSKIIEYGGEGIKHLTVPKRATITNMGAELGATTSVFPSDEQTEVFLRAQGRESCYKPLSADTDAKYDEEYTIDLSSLRPLAACPHSPDNVVPVSQIEGLKVDQVAIGSCTNSSFADMMTIANILRGNKIHDNVSLVIAPGSRQVLSMLSQNGALADMINAGARILESACGPCIGMGQAPASNSVSLRTFNRNFYGRSGTESAGVYIVSPEVAAYSAITGVLSDPSSISDAYPENLPDLYYINDNMIIEPPLHNSQVKVMKGPNIKPFPVGEPLPDKIEKTVLIKLEDNITTDHIMPSNAKLLPFRSNIPYLAEFCLAPCDSGFAKRAMAENGGFIVAGSNYGQGSSREHAALAPLYLKVKAVIAKSFARIHEANLINSGILPLLFEDENDYERIEPGDKITIDNIHQNLKEPGYCKLYLDIADKGIKIPVKINLSERQRLIILAGGQLNYEAQRVNQ